MKASLDNSKVNTILLAFLALIGCGFVLFMLRELLLTLIVAVFFSVIFKPILQFLRRKRVPHGLAFSC